MTARRNAGGWDVLLTLVLAGCTGSKIPPRNWEDTPAPTITVALPESLTAHIATVAVAPLTGTVIRFMAFMRPDPDHTTPITLSADRSPRLVRVRPSGEVHHGDTLAILADSMGRDTSAIAAPRGGTWWPARDPHATLAFGDTIGVVQHEGRYIAEGRIEGLDAQLAEVGDSSIVTFRVRGVPRTSHGRIESLMSSTYGTDVAVHFHDVGALAEPGDLVQVAIFPATTRGEAIEVPKTSLAHLSWGTAVFVPVGPGTFQARLVATDEHQPNMTVIHHGLAGATRVVEAPSAALVAAAEDSFRRLGADH